MLAGDHAWGDGGHPAALRPRGLWRRGAARWGLATLWRGYRQALAARPACLPVRAGTRVTRAANDDWLHHPDILLAAALPL